VLSLNVHELVIRGGLFHYISLNGLFIMSYSSTIQILKVNAVETGVSQKNGAKWERHTAETMLLTDDGTIDVVGKLDIPPSLRGQVIPGIFRAGFALVVPTYGTEQGKIVSRLVSLMPIPVRQAPAPAAVAKS